MASYKVTNDSFTVIGDSVSLDVLVTSSAMSSSYIVTRNESSAGNRVYVTTECGKNIIVTPAYLLITNLAGETIQYVETLQNLSTSFFKTSCGISIMTDIPNLYYPDGGATNIVMIDDDDCVYRYTSSRVIYSDDDCSCTFMTDSGTSFTFTHDGLRWVAMKYNRKTFDLV